MKYVTFFGYAGEQIIIFPSKIQHLDFAKSIEKLSYGTMRPMSGGFIIDGKCTGRSESLNMESRGELDTALIGDMLNLEGVPLDEYLKSVRPGVDMNSGYAPINKNKAKRDRKMRSK